MLKRTNSNLSTVYAFIPLDIEHCGASIGDGFDAIKNEFKHIYSYSDNTFTY